MIMDDKVCQKCCHRCVCYKYENIIGGMKTYEDYFGKDTICLDFLRVDFPEESDEQEQKVVEFNLFDVEETFDDCTVQVLKNSVTGEISLGWWRNDNPPFLIGVD